MESGSLDADEIHCPGIFVDRVVKTINNVKLIDNLVVKMGSGLSIAAKSEAERQVRIRIARRCANEIKPNMFVNLGIGMPTTVANFVDPKFNVFLHGENGLMGIGGYPMPGKEDPDCVNAGKETTTVRQSGSIVSSSTAFSIIRGGHLDLSVLGGLEVS